jgi:hypothetical protein
MMRAILGTAGLILLMSPPAFATEQCDGTCPNADEIMVSFADGNNLSCSCVKAGAPMNDDTTEFDEANPPPPGPEGDQQS